MSSQSATTPMPTQDLPPVCAWCPGFDVSDPRNAGRSHGICPECRALHFGDVMVPQIALAPPWANRRRHDALVRIAEAMRDYLVTTSRREIAGFTDLTSTQQARLLAGALVGISSIDVGKLLRDTREEGK